MKNKLNSKLENLFAVVLLLAIWQAAALLLNQKLLIPSPAHVAARLFTIWQEPEFSGSVLFSFLRIAGGYFSALILGCVLAILAGASKYMEVLLRPMMVTIKSVPVASFVIIALIWLSSGNLSIFISFLMVLPVIYNNVLSGIKHIDPKMLEMADIFRLSTGKRITYIWLPAVKSHIKAASATALGMAWKSGIAAEVIGIPGGSIGEQLYMAKAYLNTTDLFAWTVVIVILSVGFEKLCMYLLSFGYRKLEEL